MRVHPIGIENEPNHDDTTNSKQILSPNYLETETMNMTEKRELSSAILSTLCRVLDAIVDNDRFHHADITALINETSSIVKRVGNLNLKRANAERYLRKFETSANEGLRYVTAHDTEDTAFDNLLISTRVGWLVLDDAKRAVIARKAQVEAEAEANAQALAKLGELIDYRASGTLVKFATTNQANVFAILVDQGEKAGQRYVVSKYRRGATEWTNGRYSNFEAVAKQHFRKIS